MPSRDGPVFRPVGRGTAILRADIRRADALKANGPAYQRSGRNYQAGRFHNTLNHWAPGTLKPAGSLSLRPKQALFSQMDLFTAIAVAIVVVFIIAIVVMSGWLR
jgi:hypothetical protein